MARRRGCIARWCTTGVSRSTCPPIRARASSASYFLLAATAAPGQSLTDIASAIDAELQVLIDGGPSLAEMERAAAQIEAHFLYRLQTVGGFGGKSDQLNAYNVFCGDPGVLLARCGPLSRGHAARASGQRRPVCFDSTRASF